MQALARARRALRASLGRQYAGIRSVLRQSIRAVRPDRKSYARREQTTALLRSAAEYAARSLYATLVARVRDSATREAKAIAADLRRKGVQVRSLDSLASEAASRSLGQQLDGRTAADRVYMATNFMLVHQPLLDAGSTKDFRQAVYGRESPKKGHSVWKAVAKVYRAEQVRAGHAVAVSLYAQAGLRVNWVLSPVHEFTSRRDVCEALAAGSPYSALAVPPVPHAGCMCELHADFLEKS